MMWGILMIVLFGWVSSLHLEPSVCHFNLTLAKAVAKSSTSRRLKQVQARSPRLQNQEGLPYTLWFSKIKQTIYKENYKETKDVKPCCISDPLQFNGPASLVGQGATWTRRVRGTRSARKDVTRKTGRNPHFSMTTKPLLAQRNLEYAPCFLPKAFRRQQKLNLWPRILSNQRGNQQLDLVQPR